MLMDKSVGHHRLSLLFIGVILLPSLLSCSHNSEPENGASQVAAKVNGHEITVHQLNFLLSNTDSKTPKASDIRSDALNKLITQQLLYDVGLKFKVDRNSDVMMAIETAKRQIISQAYLKQATANIGDPSDAEVKQYFDANPNLFTQRKIFGFQEIVVVGQETSFSELVEFVSKTDSIEAVAAWLKTRQIQFRTGASQRASEQMSQNLLSTLTALKLGELSVVKDGSNTMILRLMESQLAPVEFTNVEQVIRRKLHHINIQNAVELEIARLKASADISYSKPYAIPDEPMDDDTTPHPITTEQGGEVDD